MKPSKNNDKAQATMVMPGPRVGTICLLRYAVLAFVAAGLGLLALRSEAALAVPPNDNFANAIAVATPSTGDIVAVADTSGATTEGGEPTPCGLIGATAWYTWTSPASAGVAAFDTYGSDFNTVLGIYTGAVLPNLINQNCNDNFGATRSGAALSYTASTTYYIQVGGASGATGNLVLNMTTGASMLVDSPGNANNADTVLNVREAMLVAKGGTGVNGLNRALTAQESALILNAGGAGLLGKDLIHFSPAVFPPASPVTVGLTSGLAMEHYDNVSGIGAGVIVDGVNNSLNCFSLDGTDVAIIEGLEIRRCSNGVIMSSSADYNRIGGSVIPAQANTIRENGTGIYISGTGNVVVGNRIGTDRTGLYDMGNTEAVFVFSGQNNRIGGPGALERNIISGNIAGVDTAVPSSGTIIENNYVGLAADGLLAIPNNDAGVHLSGTGEAVDDNVISGNGTGLALAGQSAFVRGNFIGTNATGQFAVGNNVGVHANTGDNNFIGQGALGNVISGNIQHGVLINNGAWGNFVSGNRIGVDAEGDDGLGNGGNGVYIAGDASSNAVGANFLSSRNIISGNIGEGVRIEGGAGGKGSMTSFGGPVPIPNPGFVDSDINVLRHGLVTDVEVTVNSITHPATSELNLSLEAPNGDVIYLSTLTGGAAGNYSSTKFDDEAATSITTATPPFTGTFRPEEPLADLDGIDPYGEWTLRVQDVFLGAAGTLGTWTLHVTTQGNSVQGNYIGPDVNGTTNFANWSDGVFVSGIGNLIGGTEAVARNVISGNAGSGIEMQGFAANARTYTSNVAKAIPDFTTVTSSLSVPNEAKVTDVNVQLNITHLTTADLDITLIGPDGAPVELSTDNGGSGDNYSNTVFDDEAGTAITAGAAPFNGNFRPEGKLRALDGKDAGGVWTLQVGDDSILPAGTLNGWSLTLTLAGNAVQGNYIGTNVSGNAALANQGGGVVLGDLASGTLIGGEVAGAGNLISANLGAGIFMSSSWAESNKVQGNLIGTDASGNADLGNSDSGIDIRSASNLIGGTSPAARNVVSGNTYGIFMQNAGATDNRVQGNYIGTNSAGSADLGATGSGVVIAIAGGNFIGGATAGSGNVISGNGGQGVSLIAGSTGNTVQRNFIGTNAAGTQTIGNDVNGVWVSASSGNLIGGTTPGAGNVIGGSSGNGIYLSDAGATSNTLQGNYIGTDASGSLNLGNGGDGVQLSNFASSNTIGGVAPGNGNIIAFNGSDGVEIILATVNVPIRGNRIYKNSGPGIDLGPNGVTANDAAPDADGSAPNPVVANQLQNFPVITGVSVDTVLDNTTVNGTMESAFSTFFTLDFYYSFECDASGYGEGEVYLGTGGTTTNGSGLGSFSMQWDVEIPAGTFITATATDPQGNTSEFSNCMSAFNDGDDDNDGYADVNEGMIGTNPNDPCGAHWPSNLTDDGVSANKLDIQDIVSFMAPVRLLDKSPGPGSPYNPRWDLAPGANPPFGNHINIIDITTVLSGPAGSPANPPMFGGSRAFGKVCAYGP